MHNKHKVHCCVLHGCNFDEEDCPVENGILDQEHICEFCTDSGIKTTDEIKLILEEETQHCPCCGYELHQ